MFERARLHDEAAHDAMERGAVEHARLRELQEVAHVFRGHAGRERDRDRSEGGLEHGAMLRELLGRLVRERDRLGRRGVADRDRGDRDARLGRAPGVGRELRDLLDDVEPFADAAEQRELPRERRLLGDAHEELRAAAVRLSRPQRRADRAARERLRAVLRLQHAEPARPDLRRPLAGILRQRIAPLDDAVPHHAMERRVRVRPLAAPAS